MSFISSTVRSSRFTFIDISSKKSKAEKEKKKNSPIYLMVLPVRRRIHWGIGRFCFWALASFCLVRKDFWLCINRRREHCQPHATPVRHKFMGVTEIRDTICIHSRSANRVLTYRHLDWFGVVRDTELGVLSSNLEESVNFGSVVWEGSLGVGHVSVKSWRGRRGLGVLYDPADSIMWLCEQSVTI